MDRRIMLVGSAVFTAGCAMRFDTGVKMAMYGLIGKMKSKPGQRATLSAILLEGLVGMPGCLSYIVANDPADDDLLWITEAWESEKAHKASLSLPSVQQAITKGRPLIAAMESVSETIPVGGHGLKGAR